MFPDVCHAQAGKITWNINFAKVVRIGLYVKLGRNESRQAEF